MLLRFMSLLASFFILWQCSVMPLLKAQKHELAQKYLASVESANNVIVLAFHAIPVNELNQVRMDLYEAQWTIEIVKKRVLLKWLAWKFDGLTLDQAWWSVALLYSQNEEEPFAPLKVISNHIKAWKKAKLEFSFDYVGWWIDATWQDKDHVTELANLPSKEELVWKFIYMLNHPVSSFARVLQAIADKPTEEDHVPAEATEA